MSKQDEILYTEVLYTRVALTNKVEDGIKTPVIIRGAVRASLGEFDMDPGARILALQATEERAAARETTKAVNALVSQIFANVDDHGWPIDALYSMRYSTKAWPCGYQDSQAYFSTPEGVMQAIADLKYFAELEDNSYIIYGYEYWDWGPEPISLEEIQDHMVSADEEFVW